MTELSLTPSAGELFLAHFLQDLEACGPAAVDEYACRRPDLAEQLRELARLGSALAAVGPPPEPPPAPPVPETVAGYRILRRVGRGGMGEVYEARGSKRRVAVKVIRREIASKDALARFRREMRVLRGRDLRHRHIVRILAAGKVGPLHYLVMPFIDGASLGALVQTARAAAAAEPGRTTPSFARLVGRATRASRDGLAPAAVPPRPRGGASPVRLSPGYLRSAVRVVADAAEAVHCAHQAGIVHRDLKPSNIMVDRGGRCFVIDFGLAGAAPGRAGAPAWKGPGGGLDELTGESVLGTPEYMPPEQFQGRSDARSDVWGLGATLYELLTLRRAFDGPTLTEIRTQVECGQPASPLELVTDLPPDLARVCLKALAKDPAARQQTARALADDLRQWLAAQPRRRRAPCRLAEWLRRRRLPAVILISLALALGLALARREAPPAPQQPRGVVPAGATPPGLPARPPRTATSS
jgi:serine/threonine protein kinase